MFTRNNKNTQAVADPNAQAATALQQQANNNKNNFFNIKFISKTLLLHWPWFVLSVIICVGVALVYMRYTPAVYQVTAKVLIKDEMDQKRPSNKIAAAENLGIISSSDGFDNELELLKSTSLAEGAVRDLKLYVNYKTKGRITDKAIYRTNPVIVDMDQEHLNQLKNNVTLNIAREGDNYTVEGKYKDADDNKQSFKQSGKLPMSIKTSVGSISITVNPEQILNWDGSDEIIASISNPTEVAKTYAKGIDVSALSKTTTIASIVRNDILPERGIDYLKQLSEVYNRQANDDKNIIAVRTEQFINQRLEKINAELGSTDGAIETFKRQNNMVDVSTIAGQAADNTDETDKKMAEIQTQLLLLQSVKDYMRMPENKYQTLPSNVGLTDVAATTLISQYNNIALSRNKLLATGSEINPTVQALTSQLDELAASINRAIDQSSKNQRIQLNSIVQRLNKYSSMISQAPQHERFLTEIGRQQTVKSSLYIMLLQKREENSIELAATADKGRLIDEPVCVGKVQPKGSMILLIALLLGLALPYAIFVLKELLRFRIEGHQDVESLTNCPIIADIAMASDVAKGRGDIVVKENNNNQMEEIFRSMRTNLQFILKENEKVVMFTSSTSGEGKTFTAVNLAVSFALLGKKVLLVGLDIRRPRLSNLFNLNNEMTGISTLLAQGKITKDDVKSQIVSSDINANLDLLMAGPVPPNPSELVARQSLDDIFTILREEYDYIIVDTAPVGLVTDTLVIGRVVDATVILCRADYTERSAFTMINEYAEAGKLPNVCIAINGIDMSKKKYGYAYGYGKYGKYGKYGSSNYGVGSYGYGSYHNSHYGNPNDNSIKK